MLIPIEEVPLGARIPTKNPKPWEYNDSLPEPDQATWAKLSITMYRTDGGIVDAELIRPRSWIKSAGIEAGKLLPMNIEELQVKGSALVTAIDDCPEIAGSSQPAALARELGSVVTARFCTREVHTVARVEILGPDGQIETLEGTTIHPIWSEDRQDWVPLGELLPNETLRAADGPAVVLSLIILNQPIAVYNIEVHGEYVYQVGQLGLLVHNECVYQAFDAAGNVIYVGITNNLTRRAAQHLRTKGITIVEYFSKLTRSEARAVEQALIDLHGLGKTGGKLLNKINSIAANNPIYDDAIAQGWSILTKMGF